MTGFCGHNKSLGVHERWKISPPADLPSASQEGLFSLFLVNYRPHRNSCENSNFGVPRTHIYYYGV
jgi:hypothetical protein